MEAFIEYILRFGHLNTQQIELVKSLTQEKEIKKGSYFSEAGKVAQEVGFLESGIFRVCYYGSKGEEFTRCIVPKHRFMVDMNSFYNNTPSSEYVEALTDSRMIILDKAAFTELGNTIIPWNEIFTKIMSHALMRKMNDSQMMLQQDAKTRYLSFLELFPGLANQIPLSTLASYLGITQSSLSRIRKNIS